MKNETIKKINNCYKNLYLSITTISILIILLLSKNMYFDLYNINLKNFTQNEQTIANITYLIFSITTSLAFLIKHKSDTESQFKKYMKIALTGFATILIYKLTPILELAILYYSKINISKMTIMAKTIYLIICEIIIMGIIAIINKEKLKKNFKDIKINYNEYFKKYLKLYILALIIMMISNLIINSITNNIAGNEETIRNTFNKAPIYMFFSAVIFAPFTEEMVFRNSIKNIITNKNTFILISGLIFGALHVIGNITTIYDVLYIIPYATPGIALAIMLEKTDNIFVPMGIHFLHNGLLMTLQAILLFLK